MTTPPSPTRAALGHQLRRLREAAELTIDQVCGKLECSASKISRIETGHIGVTPRDVRDMLELYPVGHDQREALIQQARAARTPGRTGRHGPARRRAVTLHLSAGESIGDT